MAYFEQEFILHPVGQGLFYSGQIKINHRVVFRMVFDCGSKKDRKDAQQEVSIYRDQSLKEKILDLLVISHFDADHVNRIKDLLHGNVKVKRVVMPFITFEERLFLVLRYLQDLKNITPEDIEIAEFMLDPLGALADNLDPDSEVYFVANNPDSIPTEDDQIKAGTEEPKSVDDEGRLDFQFDNKDPLDAQELNLSKPQNSAQLHKVGDSQKGRVRTGSGLILMDFLFYSRKLTEDDKQFCAIVYTCFREKYNLNKGCSIDELMEVVKLIQSSPPIKAVLKEAIVTLRVSNKLVGRKGVELNNLNTSSLCLLHRNLRSIHSLINKDTMSNSRRASMSGIQKFISKSGVSRIELKYWRDNEQKCFITNPRHRFVYPNTLLTSDTFLQSKEQVQEFMYKYQYYWNEFWLFQIPHHGSKESGNEVMFSQIPANSICFVNFGIGNRDRHPSTPVINDLVKTGNSAELVSITQYYGLRFNLLIG